jgi:HSP20 family protein
MTRYSPYYESLDELFRGFFVRPVNFEGPASTGQFRVEVAEKDNAYVLRGELPGVK